MGRGAAGREPGLLESSSTSPGSERHVGPQQAVGCPRPQESERPPRAGPSLTLARVSTTPTSGCFAGYLAMSHSKWVTKDVKSTGGTQIHFHR